MASDPIIVLVLFLLSFTMLLANEATAAENIIELGSSLSPKGNTSSWVSISGHFAFGFYPQGDDGGYAVGIWLVVDATDQSKNTVVWTANRDDPPVSSSSTLQLTKDGLLLQQDRGKTRNLLIANDSGTAEEAGSASMLDSGNFVIYGKAANNMTKYVLWQSFDYPTDTILGGQNLTNVNELVSSMSESDHSSGHFYLMMSGNNSLFAYPITSLPDTEDFYWSHIMAASYSSASANRGYRGSNPLENVRQSPRARGYYKRGGATDGVVYLSLNLEGFLCLVDSQCLSNITILTQNSNNNTTSIIYRATLDFDGNFRLYEHRFDSSKQNSNSVTTQTTLWEALPDVCQINGFCGFNSYCSNMTGRATCECYPGFTPNAENNKSNSISNMFLECRPVYYKDDCEVSDDPISLYNVTSLEEIWWGDSDSPYWLTPTTMEECEKSCKEDCDCGAALYTSGGSCNKYRLPLRYGRKTSNSSASAIFKVPPGHVNGFDHTRPVKQEVVIDNKRGLLMTLSFTLGCVSLFCVVFAVYVFFNYRSEVCTYTKLSARSNLGFSECSLRLFSFDELVKATGGFREEVGRGSFGAVYRGEIGESNRVVAVKRLEKVVDEGEKEFRAEIKAIARTHHRNLVKLIGYCIDGCKKLLVYEYLSNGSLANLLFKAKKHLPFQERVKIALDVARGVQYLHEECEVCIIHCNLKPQNVLMDEEWNAKISDFGFARLLKPERSRARPGDDEATSGYFAPEWQKEDSLISVKTDIYSYGVVLLEIACRRRNIEVNVSSQEEVLLSSWVYQCFAAGQLNKLVACDNEDEDEDVDWKTLERMVKVGLWCVQDDPTLRPSMKNVILMLEGWKDTPIPPSPSSL